MPATLVPSREAAEAALPVPFSCSSTVVGSWVQITLIGEVDLFTASELVDALRRAEATATTIVLDLRRLEFIDCCGVGALLAADRRIRAAGGRLLVVRAPAKLEWLLILVGRDLQLQFVDEPPLPHHGTALQASTPAVARLLDVPPVALFDLPPVIDVRLAGGPPQLPPSGGPPASAAPAPAEARGRLTR